MVDVLNLKATIGKGGIDEEREDQVGTIWCCIRMGITFTYRELTWLSKKRREWTRENQEPSPKSLY